MRAALYSRVSKDEGNVARQVDETRAFAKARGWKIVAEESDKASGAKEDRAGLARVMKLARARKCDVIVVQALDRFARSIKHFVRDYRGTGSSRRRVRLHVARFRPRPRPMGRFAVTMMAAVAELERNMIRERILSGLAKARRDGKRLGRPVAGVSPLKLRKLVDRKTPVRAIARELGISRTAVVHAIESL